MFCLLLLAVGTYTWTSLEGLISSQEFITSDNPEREVIAECPANPECDFYKEKCDRCKLEVEKCYSLKFLGFFRINNFLIF